jgi:hypothetical protein
MILGYYRLGKFEDARRSLRHWLTFAERFRLDNPLVQFGSEVYQPNQPINLTYDAFGPPAAFVRGLFEYLYRADELTLLPHVPPGITRLEQRFPVRFGTKRLYLATVGSGPITAVTMNGNPGRSFDRASIVLPYDQSPKPPPSKSLSAMPPRSASTRRHRDSPRRKSRPTTAPGCNFNRTPSAKPPHRPRRRSSNCSPTPRASIVSRNCSARKISPTLTQPPTPGSPSTPSPRPIIGSRCWRTISSSPWPIRFPAPPRIGSTSIPPGNSADGLAQVLTTYATATDPDKLRIAQLWQHCANAP